MEDERMQELINLEKKQVFYVRLSAVFIGVLAAVVTICALIIVPQVQTTLNRANDMIVSADSAIADIKTMSASITKTSENMNDLVSKNAETLTDSVKKLSEVDFEGINDAVNDLQAAVGPLADAVESLRGFSLFGR